MTATCVLRNGIVSTLTTCGPYDSAQISSCDYGILERNSGCAVIVHYGPEENIEPITYGGTIDQSTKFKVIQFTGECFIRFTGDVQKFLGDVYRARDDLDATFAKDDTLQSSACFGYVSGYRYNIDEGYNMGGKDWGVLRFILTIHDF